MTTPTIPPYDEDLDQPYSAYPSVRLNKTKYPETAIWGLGTRCVVPNAIMVFEPWTTVTENDNFAIYFKDMINPAASAIISDNTRARYNLSIGAENMPEGEVKMFGRVTRAASGHESRSPVVTILIKTSLPGGYDRRVWEPWHSELKMSIEGLTEGSPINADHIKNGVWCLVTKYLNCRKNDVITVVAGGVAVEHTVSPEEAAGPGPIRIFIEPKDLASISLSGEVGFVFNVRDVVGNVSGGKYAYSKPYLLTNELNPNLKEAPIFLIDYVESPTVDLDTQSQSTFSVQVTVPRKSPTPKPPYRIIVVMDMYRADGSKQTVRLDPVNDRNLRGEIIDIPNDLITSLAGGWFRVTFEWIASATATPEYSASYTVTVVGTPVLMPAVTVSPIEAGQIPLGRDLTVTMPNYEPHHRDWLETLVLELMEDGGSGERHTQPQPAGPQGGTRLVKREELKRFEGKGPFWIYYMTDDGKGTPSSIRVSLRLEAQVGARDEVLPAPIIQGAVGNNIDPKDVREPEVLMIIPYTGTKVGDVVHWTITGLTAAGSASGTITITNAIAGGVLSTVFFPVDRKILDFNNNGSFSCTYSVERRGPPRQVFRSKVLNLTVGQSVVLEPLKVLEADQLQQRLNPAAVFNGATVRAAYRSMLDTDQIKLNWAGAFGISNIELKAWGDPKTNVVTFTIPPDIIAKAIRPGGNSITLTCSVIRGSFTYTFETLTLALLPLAVLPTPTIDGIGDSKVLPLYLLADTALTRVAPWSFIHKDQLTWETYNGTYDDGTPFAKDTYNAKPVTAARVANGVSELAPVDDLRRLKAGSPLTISFWASFAQIPDKNTAVLFSKREYLIQTVPATLPAPAFANQVKPALSIYPLDYETTASVRVAYPGMNATQPIELQWLFPDGILADIPAKNGAATGYVDFAISEQILARSVGKVIALRYVTIIDGNRRESAVQTLTVQSIRTSDLPLVLINKLPNNGTLDLRTFVGDALAEVPKWRLSAPKQRIWVTFSSPYVKDLVVREGVVVTYDQALNGLVNIEVALSWLRQVKLPQITVTCKVTFDGDISETTAVVFPQSTYNIRWSQGVLETISVGSLPHWVVITRDGKTAYVTNYGSSTVSVIDINLRKVVRTLSGFDGPFRIALHPDESRLYVGNLASKDVAVVNPADGSIIQRFPGFQYIWGLAVNASGTRLFVSSRPEAMVFVLDAMTGARLNSIPAADVRGLTFNPQQSLLYAGGGRQVTVMNGAGTGGVVKTIAGFNPATDIAFNPNDAPYPRAYVTNTNAVLLIDTASNVIYKTLGGFYNTYSVAMNPLIRECYVSTNSNSFTVINTHAETIDRTYYDFQNPAGIAVTPNGKLALVANHASGTLAFVVV